MEKTIKYLENGEYHYATVRSVGDLAQLKTDSKETLVEAINELWNGGGNADPSKAPKPEGYDQLVQDVADAVKNQQEISQQWIEWQNEEAQLTEERKQAYLQAMKEMQEAIDKAKADAAALDDKTTKLDEQITKTFSDLDTSIQNMHEQLQKEADRMNQELIDTKSDLTKVRTDLQNAQLDNGRIHDELTNINGKFEHKVWQTDLDPLKEQIDRAETSIQQTKDELLGKASREDLDTVTNAVSKLDTQLKETAKGVEISVKKDELSGDVARLLNDKTNLLLGTRNFSGEDNWKNRDAVTIEPGYYKGLKSVAVQVTDRSIYQPYHVKANTVYTFSFFGKEDRDNPKATLVIKPIDAPNINIDNAEQPVHITTEWQRFAVTFSADQDCDISIQIIQGSEASNNILHLAGFKLQYGQNNTPWEPNEADVAENIEHTESQFNIYSDQIAGIVKKQEKMGDTERQLDTRITETAEGLKQTSKDLQDANGKITEFKGQLESTARGLKTEYEKYTNDAVGQISDSTLNLIRNSSFQNKDSDFDQWQNISTKANVRSDENGLRWVELTQSGLTTNNPEGITSNYFNIKQGKVTVAVDIKSGDKASLDNDSVLSLELYNDVKKRVDFYGVSLSQLGLSKELLGDHKVHRGLYRLGIDRNDAKYMTVKAKLVKNGDLYFTNFSARLSSIDDGAYEPNPDDLNQQILKQNTKIEQNAKEVAIKANSVDVTRDIKSAVDGIKVGGTNLAAGTNQEYTMGFGIPNTTWKDGFAYATLPTTYGGAEILPQPPHDFWYTLTAGQEYTQTIWFQTDATVKDLSTASITWFIGGAHDYQPATIQKIGPNSYKLFNSYKWPGKNSNNVRLFDIGTLSRAFDLNTGTYLKFGKLKLEEGNKSTSWSPAPEDTSAEIKSAKDAAIQVASDQINIHVNELTTSFDDKLNKRVNEVKTASEKFTSDGIEQTVTKITDVKNDVDRLGNKVDGISVGGTNLAFNTDTSYSGKNGQYGSIGGMTVSRINELLGQTITISVDVEWEGWKKDGSLPQNRIGWELQLNYKDGSASDYPGAWFNPTTADGKRRIAATYTLRQKEVASLGENFAYIQINCTNAKVSHLKIEKGNKSTDWSPAPEDVNKKIDTQTLDSANINDLKTQGHYFVKNLTGNPIGGWVYVDVTGNNNDRIRQDVYQDNGTKHMYRRLFGSSWSDWEQGAYLSDVSSLKTEVTASVKNLGDRVTTEVNSITTRQNNFENDSKMQHSNDTELVRKSDFEDGSKGNWTVTGVVSATNPAPPAELGQAGMKVLQTNSRDGYEDGIWYSVKPGEKFDVDYWCAPSTAFRTTFGLNFADKNKENYNWQGVSSDQSGQWKHYTGTVTAPANASFARPWFQMEKPVNNTTNSSWIAKPHIRRQNPATIEAIKTLNTKWDVANGQIQGKVTETQVNNILNGKGYATQSWAQTQFQMKSDSITLQAVRDNITNGIQNQVNDTRNQINGLQNQFNTQTGINLLKGTADFSGPWFNKNGKGWSCNGEWQPPTSENKSERNNNVVYQDSGHAWDGLGQTVELNTGEYTFSMWMWPTLSGNESMNIYVGDSQYGGTAKVNYSGYSYSASQPQNRWILVKTYLTVTQGGKLSIRPELNQASGTIHVASYMLQHGHVENPVWAPAPDDLAPKSIISSINITPDQIKIASNKIVIDGNTDIHGDLRTDRVRLVGKQGLIDMTGDDGMRMANKNGSSILIGNGNIDLMYNNDFRMNIDSSMMTLLKKESALGQNNPIAIGSIGTSFYANDKRRGMQILYTPGKDDWSYRGADYLGFGYSLDNEGQQGQRKIHDQLELYRQDTTINNHLKRKGIHVQDALHIYDGQSIYLENQTNSILDPIRIDGRRFPASAQPDNFQPFLTLGYSSKNFGEAGLGLNWHELVPSGRINSTYTYMSANGTDYNGGLVVGWTSWGDYYNNRKVPCIHYYDPGTTNPDGCIAFYQDGAVIIYSQGKRYHAGINLTELH